MFGRRVGRAALKALARPAEAITARRTLSIAPRVPVRTIRAFERAPVVNRPAPYTLCVKTPDTFSRLRVLAGHVPSRPSRRRHAMRRFGAVLHADKLPESK